MGETINNSRLDMLTTITSGGYINLDNGLDQETIEQLKEDDQTLLYDTPTTVKYLELCGEDPSSLKRKFLSKTRTQEVSIRVTSDEKEKLESLASSYGFKNLSEYIRFVSLNAILKAEFTKQ